MLPFSIHATRGLIRDQTTRRRAMFVALLAAMLLLVLGSTFLQPLLISHPVWFVLFWFACAWLTLLAVLLALFDLLVGRVQARAAKKVLRAELPTTEDSSSEREEK